MKEMLHAMLAKTKPAKLDPAEKEAKMNVLKDIHKMASHDMGESIKGMQGDKGLNMGKVEVHSNSPEGLETGLERAHDLIEQTKDEGTDKDFAQSDMEHPEEDEDDFEDHAEENKSLQGKELGKHEKHVAEEPSEVEPEDERGEMSDDEIDEMIKHLHSKKKNK